GVVEGRGGERWLFFPLSEPEPTAKQVESAEEMRVYPRAAHRWKKGLPARSRQARRFSARRAPH
ncbi:MAG: hypothetical protein MK312_11140, partial [Roseibacillus sp.]|nr:hypothetical protein [Roseibacillus sp.]